jgi:hypothetical protein
MVVKHRSRKDATALKRPVDAEPPAIGLTRRFVAWIGGGAIAIAATTATAHVTGLLDRILPGPSDTICQFIEAPFVEKSLKGRLPGVLVASFSGSGGREAARNLSDEIRYRTGLPVISTCIILPTSSGTDASFESVGKALDEARHLTKERGARVVILGAMRQDGIADLALTHTEDEGRSSTVTQEYNSPAKLLTFRM